jgi:hypothetical protein
MRVHRNCCGLDVHKQTIAACLISESEDGTVRCPWYCSSTASASRNASLAP